MTATQSRLTKSDVYYINRTIQNYLDNHDRQHLLPPYCDFDPATDAEPLDAYIKKSPRYATEWAEMRERHGLAIPAHQAAA